MLTTIETTKLNDLDKEIAGLGRGKNDNIKLGDKLNEIIAGTVQWKAIRMVPGNNTPVDTGWDLPAQAMVVDVLVKVDVSESGGTVDIGTLAGESGGDADGFADGLDVSTTGLKRPGATVTGGVFSARTRGALLSDYAVGTNADDRGLYLEKPYLTDSVAAKSVGYTRSGTFTTLDATLLIGYVEF